MNRLVAPLVRRHNLAIFMIFLAGLSAIAVVSTTHIFPDLPGWIGYLTAVRVVLPIAALIATAIVTQSRMTSAARRARGAAIEIDDARGAFESSKNFATWSMAFCGLVAASSLLFGHRTLDIALALVPLLLMVLGRPSVAAFVTFYDLLRAESSSASESQSR